MITTLSKAQIYVPFSIGYGKAVAVGFGVGTDISMNSNIYLQAQTDIKANLSRDYDKGAMGGGHIAIGFKYNDNLSIETGVGYYRVWYDLGGATYDTTGMDSIDRHYIVDGPHNYWAYNIYGRVIWKSIFIEYNYINKDGNYFTIGVKCKL